MAVKPVTFLNALLQMICVSYTILLAVFCLIEIIAGAVAPLDPAEVLILLMMAALVSLWNMLVKSRLSSPKVLLLRYAGSTVIVLTVGIAWERFIPPLQDILVTCAIVAAVFLGTWAYLCVTAKVEAAEINRALKKHGQRRRKQP
ncbi:MAG: DUF3021 domain-containing protein [Clostridia bacterium]|nr:DUF3021 domain-containing protein [Clostridia bacterium]